MSTKRSNRTASYLVKMTPDEKQHLDARAEMAGVPLAEAFRNGAEMYLAEQLEGQTADPLANELRSLARQVDRRFRQ